MPLGWYRVLSLKINFLLPLYSCWMLGYSNSVHQAQLHVQDLYQTDNGPTNQLELCVVL